MPMNQDNTGDNNKNLNNPSAPKIPAFEEQFNQPSSQTALSEEAGGQNPPSGTSSIIPVSQEALSTVVNKISQSTPKTPAGKTSSSVGTKQANKTTDPKATNAAKDPKATKKSKDDSPFLQRALILLGIVVFCLLPIIPKQAGGDIEVSGAPVGSQALIRPSLSGTLTSIPVSTNERVREGQVVATLKNWEIEEKLVNAKRQLSRSIASIGSLEAQEAVAKEEFNKSREFYNRMAAESNYVQSNASLSRTRNLPPRLDTTQKQYEQLKLQAESLSQKAALYKTLAEEGVFPRQSALQSAYEAVAATKQSEALKSQLKAETFELRQAAIEDLPKLRESEKAVSANLQRVGTIQKEIQVTKAEIAWLEEEIALLERELDSLTIRSPIDGVVLTLNTALLLGQNFNRGDTIITVGELNRRVRVTLQLPEEDRAYIAKGMKVNAHIRAVPNRNFEGVVDEIAPVNSETGENTNKRRISEITVFLNNPATKEKPNGILTAGMTGYARIETKKTNSLFGLVVEEVYKAFRLDRFI
ncbi:MAG: HlyD family efflux transporter periplasmic adaptor subunit [Candidatus Caenarcaniphilales bacterium]|nr:HlyD family efflux transporter periplasmic adaptor subunit [Candidatus Caenarcaniphilales bacterium]